MGSQSSTPDLQECSFRSHEIDTEWAIRTVDGMTRNVARGPKAGSYVEPNPLSADNPTQVAAARQKNLTLKASTLAMWTQSAWCALRRIAVAIMTDSTTS